jgi:putative FmdB family regulatory protein
MPIYDYQCVDCNEREKMIAGLDDHVTLCTKCGGLMLRLEGDLFTPFLQCQFYRFRRRAMAKMLKNLEFEIRWSLRDLIRVQGVAVVVNSGAGQNLLKNLKAIEAYKADTTRGSQFPRR